MADVQEDIERGDYPLDEARTVLFSALEDFEEERISLLENLRGFLPAELQIDVDVVVDALTGLTDLTVDVKDPDAFNEALGAKIDFEALEAAAASLDSFTVERCDVAVSSGLSATGLEADAAPLEVSEAEWCQAYVTLGTVEAEPDAGEPPSEVLERQDRAYEIYIDGAPEEIRDTVATEIRLIAKISDEGGLSELEAEEFERSTGVIEKYIEEHCNIVRPSSPDD